MVPFEPTTLRYAPLVAENVHVTPLSVDVMRDELACPSRLAIHKLKVELQYINAHSFVVVVPLPVQVIPSVEVANAFPPAPVPPPAINVVPFQSTSNP